MANQPTVRPWFRLSSLRSVSTVPPPAPAPTQETRPSLVQPTARTNSAPSPSPPPPPPPTQPAPADRGSVPSSPVQKSPLQSSSSSSPASTPPKGSPRVAALSSVQSSSPTKKPDQPPPSSSLAKATARGSSPSPKPVVSEQSQKVKHTTPSPSPLSLPPSQLRASSETEPKIPAEAESKNVIAQKTIEKPKPWVNGNSGEIQNTHNEKQRGYHRRVSDSEDSAMRVITIAGENRGAYMELIRSPNKHDFGDKPNYLHKKGVSKTKGDGSESEISSSDERNANRNNRGLGRTKSSYPMAAFTNSNVQCVNNSLLYNASCSHHDPGVRLSLTKKPFEGGGFHVKEVVNGKHD